MGQDAMEITINLVKLIVIFLLMVQMVPLLVWVERRGSAFIQNRLGPNRVGPLGLVQLLADAVKFLLKEEFAPAKATKSIFYLAPIIALIPGALAFASIPLSVPFDISEFTFWGHQWGPYQFKTQGYDFGIGIVFVLGISSLGAYALLMAGWGSANKFSLFGALRACAQMISYELALGLSLVGLLLIFGSFSFTDIVNQQQGPLTFHFLGEKTSLGFLPNWGIFYQPLGALIFFVSIFAETNRLPFDLPEAEAELVSGYHTEYGGLKMLMFYIGEYGHMMVASALMVTFFFGGYHFPGLNPDSMLAFWETYFSVNAAQLMNMLFFHLILFSKILVFLWIFIWVRWSVPRFRYDQLMDLGWKVMLPWALFNTVVTSVVVLVMRGGV